MSYKTEQESFWAGNFGDDYIKRNSDSNLVSTNINFLSNALSKSEILKTCIEFGPNVGNNLLALKYLLPSIELNAIEINPSAREKLKEFIPTENIFEGSILEFEPLRKFDLVLIKGVLIHLNPEYLNEVYCKLVKCCSKYILIAEYYNPTPISLDYRGNKEKLYKRDFAGELLQNHSEMFLVDYGFCYKGDPNFPGDDITWFLLKKK